MEEALLWCRAALTQLCLNKLSHSALASQWKFKLHFLMPWFYIQCCWVEDHANKISVRDCRVMKERGLVKQAQTLTQHSNQNMLQPNTLLTHQSPHFKTGLCSCTACEPLSCKKKRILSDLWKTNTTTYKWAQKWRRNDFCHSLPGQSAPEGSHWYHCTPAVWNSQKLCFHFTSISNKRLWEVDCASAVEVCSIFCT